MNSPHPLPSSFKKPAPYSRLDLYQLGCGYAFLSSDDIRRLEGPEPLALRPKNMMRPSVVEPPVNLMTGETWEQEQARMRYIAERWWAIGKVVISVLVLLAWVSFWWFYARLM